MAYKNPNLNPTKAWLMQAIIGNHSQKEALENLIKNLSPLNDEPHNALSLAKYLIDNHLQGAKTASLEALEIWATILGKECFRGKQSIKCLCGEYHNVRHTKTGYYITCLKMDMTAHAFSHPTLLRSYIRMQLQFLYEEGLRFPDKLNTIIHNEPPIEQPKGE